MDDYGMTRLEAGKALDPKEVLATFHQICMRQCRSAISLTKRADDIKRAQQDRSRELKAGVTTDNSQNLWQKPLANLARWLVSV